MKRNRRKQAVVMLILMAVCLTAGGCGGYASNHGRDGRGVSDGAVSGNAVSGGAVSDKKAEGKQNGQNTGEPKYRYSTDTNMYYSDEDEEGNEYIMQARRDGTHKKEVLEMPWGELISLYCVDEHWLYYSIRNLNEEEGDEKFDTMYRIPLKKDDAGYDVAEPEKKEKLFTDEMYMEYVDTDFVIYSDADDTIKQYDLQKRKLSAEWKIKEYVENEDATADMYRIADGFVMIIDECGVYVRGTDEPEWRKLYDFSKGEPWDYGYVRQSEKSVFYCTYDTEDHFSGIRKNDLKESQAFVTKKQLEQAVRKEIEREGGRVDVFEVADIFVDGGRLYIEAAVGWQDGKNYRMEYQMFSQGEEEKELRYERELTEAMYSHVKSIEGVWGHLVWDEDEGDSRVDTVYEEHVRVNDANCVAVLNGKAYLSLYDYEKGKGRMGCYELHSGTFRWLSKKEAEYGPLSWAGIYEDGELYDEFEEYEDDATSIEEEITPSKDKEEEGSFYAGKK